MAPSLQDEAPQVVLSPLLADTIAMADNLEGDPKTVWSRLYAAQAAYLREGIPTPAPLAKTMANRLQSVAEHLAHSQKTRDGLVDAVAPTMHTLVGRKRGRRPSPATAMLGDLAEYALRLAGESPTPEKIDAAARKVCGYQSRYDISTIKIAIRKARRTAKKTHS